MDVGSSATPAARPRPEALLNRALLVVAIAASLAVLALAVWAVAYPYQTSYVEGYLLEQGARLAGGGALYRPLGEPDWVVDNFPPVYPVLVALGVKLFGPSFAFGRALTVVSVAGLFALAMWWHRRRGASATVALAVATLWLASPYVIRRALLLRMDFAAILVAALGVWAFLGLDKRKPQLAAPVAAVLFAAALGIRQTMLAAPVALLVTLLWHGRRRDAGIIAGLLAGIGALAIFVLQAWTDGGFLRHIVEYNTGRYILDNYLWRLWRTFVTQWGLVSLAVLGIAGSWKDKTFENRLVILWSILALLATVTAGKPGSTYNHFLETLWVGALLVPAGLRLVVSHAGKWLPRVTRSHPHLFGDGAIPALLLLLLLIHLPLAAVSAPVDTGISALADREADEALEDLVATTPGLVLSENAGVLVRTDHPLIIEPRTLLELKFSNEWDDASFVGEIASQNYTILVLEIFRPSHMCSLGCRFSDEAWGAIEAQYEPTSEIGRWQIWTPRSRA